MAKRRLHHRWWHVLYALLMLVTIASCPRALGQVGQARLIIAGQNTPEWNRKLGVNAMRGSCNLAPADCMNDVSGLLTGQHTNLFYLNIWDDANIGSRAAYYSAASLSEPRLCELDIDDFIDHFNNWCLRSRISATRLLSEVITRTKSKNKMLKFGLTLYEDQLASLLANPSFTPALANEIDTIHLCLHRRENGLKFANYVALVQRNFPNAVVIAVSYSYDRIDYISGPNGPWTPAQELDLYKRTLKIQLELLQKGIVGGIEFYPGRFGFEDHWPGWDDPKICKPWRKEDALKNTRAMRDATLELFTQFGMAQPLNFDSFCVSNNSSQLLTDLRSGQT